MAPAYDPPSVASRPLVAVAGIRTVPRRAPSGNGDSGRQSRHAPGPAGSCSDVRAALSRSGRLAVLAGHGIGDSQKARNLVRGDRPAEMEALRSDAAER